MDDAIKLKFDAIWKARESEQHSVRERTLLAWGFLMFCYGGYGYIAYALFMSKGMSEARFSAFNMALLFMSLVCLRLSIFWIQLAKGAKAWAENFDFIAEGFQHKFFKSQDCHLTCPFRNEKLRDSVDDSIVQVLINKNCVNCGGNPTYACVFSVNSPKSGYSTDVDENIFTSKSGAFSPSAIIISIARLSLMISTNLAIGNLVALICGKEMLVSNRCIAIRVATFLLLFVFLVIPFILLVIRDKRNRNPRNRNTESRRWWSPIIDAIVFSSSVSMGLHDNQTIRDSFR